jgi:hypothetical protein
MPPDPEKGIDFLVGLAGLGVRNADVILAELRRLYSAAGESEPSALAKWLDSAYRRGIWVMDEQEEDQGHA